MQYQRGRRARSSAWVFGIISNEFTPARGYFQVIEDRTRTTLTKIIQNVLLPGSELHIDDHPGYSNLRQYAPHVVRHRIVVHSQNFVDPLTGAHTQEIESAWNTLKLKIKAKKGLPPHRLQSFLDEQMWFSHRGKDQVFENILDILKNYFPNHPQ